MTYRFHFRLREIAGAALVLGLTLAPLSPAGARGKRKSVPKIDTSKLVWPQPPDPPRIRFITQVSGELDLLGKVEKRKTSFVERLAGISIAPEERPRMVKPYGVAADSKGRIYAADSMQSVVFVFDLNNKTLQFRGDKAPADIKVPIGVAVDDQDRLFVSDSLLHRITCFDFAGNVAGVFGTKELARPVGLAVDTALRRLYVADAGKAHIAVFDLDTFKFLRYFADGKMNEDENYFANPNGIAVDADGLLYVTDAVAGRILVLDTEGNFVRMFGKRGDGPGEFVRPKGIAIDRDGHIYVADAQLDRLQVLTPAGEPLLAVGRFGYGPGQFLVMAGLAMDNNNRLLVIDQESPRVQIFRYITEAEIAASKPAAPADSQELGQPLAKAQKTPEIRSASQAAPQASGAPK